MLAILKGETLKLIAVASEMLTGFYLSVWSYCQFVFSERCKTKVFFYAARTKLAYCSIFWHVKSRSNSSNSKLI